MSRISEITYKRTVLKRLSRKTDSVTQGVDIADIKLEGITAVMSSNSIIKWFDGCEKFALQKCINQLCEKGGVAKSVQIIIDIPEGYEEKLLGKILKNINDAVAEFNLDIAQCKVNYAQIKEPIAHLNLIGYTSYEFSSKSIRPGMDVVMAGSIAVGGTSILSRLYKEKLSEKYSAKFVRDCIDIEQVIDIRKYAEIALNNGADYLHAVTDAGAFGAIWEIASMADIGISVDVKRIPVWQETIEVAEFFGVNPYVIDGTGALIIICRDGEKIAKELTDMGALAAVIGTITEGRDRVVLNEGEERYLEPPRGDELYNIL